MYTVKYDNVTYGYSDDNKALLDAGRAIVDAALEIAQPHLDFLASMPTQKQLDRSAWIRDDIAMANLAKEARFLKIRLNRFDRDSRIHDI